MNIFSDRSWRSLGAIVFFVSAMIGFVSGVGVSERPDMARDGLTIAYYSLSLFVVGGIDLGTPVGGPAWGRGLVWLAYFGAPVWAAWTLIQAILRGFAHQALLLSRLRDHVLVISSSELSMTYLRRLRELDKRVQVVVACKYCDQSTADEIRDAFDAVVVIGDVTHDYFLKQLRPRFARRILLLGDDSMRNYEAACHILDLVPDIGRRLIVHCAQLRFLRAMADTRVAQQSQSFNSYNLAASGLVRNQLVSHFRETRPKDAVVLAGFGRFGQTVIEQLQDAALDEIKALVVIDSDVNRRVMVAEEQMSFRGEFRRELFEGDISHPQLWERVRNTVTLDSEDTVVVLGTGREEENLRTALWLRKQFPRARIIARSSTQSRFASEVGREHDIITVSIAELVEENIPEDWFTLN